MVAGVQINRDAFVSETSLNYAVTNSVTVGVSYSGQYGRRGSDSAFKGHFDISSGNDRLRVSISGLGKGACTAPSNIRAHSNVRTYCSVF